MRTLIEKMQQEIGGELPEAMKQIKLAAKYAKLLRPRQDIVTNQLKKR